MPAELLEAVFRSPDDDAPRRALAESLQRAGDPRGEFIALQLDTQRIYWSETKIGGLRRVAVDPAVIERMTALFRKHRLAWFDGTRKRLNAMGVARGFAEMAEAGVEKFLPNADAVFAAEPLRTLTLTTPKKGVWPALAAAAWWSRLRGAYVGPLKPGPAELTKLLANAGFAALRHLSLAGAPLGAEGAAALVAAPFTQLEHLELGVTGVPHGAVAALIRAPWFATLRQADLANNPTYTFDREYIAETPAERAQIVDALCALPAGLERLSLPCTLTAPDLARLGAAPIATSLRSLAVAPTDDVAAEAVAAFNERRAEPIDLSGFRVTDR